FDSSAGQQPDQHALHRLRADHSGDSRLRDLRSRLLLRSELQDVRSPAMWVKGLPWAAALAALSLWEGALALDRVAPSEYRERLPQDEVVYFLLPDRFDNGDLANDRGGLPADRLKSGFDPTDLRFYHGGDLQGLLRRLDYIQQLGATAIWLGPIYKNKPVQG